MMKPNNYNYVLIAANPIIKPIFILKITTQNLFG
jgi:hypothetical protein